MIARVRSIALAGVDGQPVDVEVSIAPGLPSFTIVGLPDPSIQEARERVRSAIQACGHEWPLRRVTVNLSPAHLRKAGPGFDLAIALGVLAVVGRVKPARLEGVTVLGELSLDGTARRVRGILPAAIACARSGGRTILVPEGNAREAALARDLEVVPARHLADAVTYLRTGRALPVPEAEPSAGEEAAECLSDVRGQELAKRALEVAAAGGHNLLMIGPPGGGKTMLARRLPGILPPMTEEEAFEVTRVHSIAGLLPEDRPLVRARPFRAPHHTCSTTGLIGGGSGLPHPGEVSLATRGVLFMDEIAEFRREALEALRQPLEHGHVTVVRAKWSVTYPARFQLIAASNPCPCGHLGDSVRSCTCLPGRVSQYRERLSGPIVDRVDLQVRVARIAKRELFASGDGETSATVRARVAAAREVQGARYASLGLTSNAEVPARSIEETTRLSAPARAVVERAMDRVGLTARGAHRVLRVARTIADLRGAEAVTPDCVEEALMFRVADGTR